MKATTSAGGPEPTSKEAETPTIDEANQFEQWQVWVDAKDWRAPCHPSQLYVPGYYKTKMGERFVQVAIWQQDGVLYFLRDGKPILEESKRLETFGYCTVTPYDEWEKINDDTSGSPIYAELPAGADEMLARAMRLEQVPDDIYDEASAKLVADKAHVLNALKKAAEAASDAETAPLKAKIKDASGKWDAVVDFCEAVRQRAMKSIGEHLKKKNEPGGVKGQLGKAISLRKETTIEVVDYPLALRHFLKSNEKDFYPIVDKLAKKFPKSPGVKEHEGSRAQ